MLVGDEDTDAVADRQTEGFQRGEGRTTAFAHIDQQVLFAAEDKGAVTG